MSLIELKMKRTVIRDKCTRVSNSFPEGMTPITRATISLARAQQKELDIFWDEYEAVQSQIESFEDGEEDRTSFEKAYYEIDARLYDIIDSPPAPKISFTQSASRPSDAGGKGSNIKLPQLNLPAFSGKSNERFSFADPFQSAIDINAAQEDADKAPTAPLPPTVQIIKNDKHVSTGNVAAVGAKCPFCNGPHYIQRCANFTNLVLEERLEEVRARKLCTNCLRSNSHSAEQCTSGVCKRCGYKHNTLLHQYQETCDPSAYSPPGGESEHSSAVVVAHTHSSRSNANAMLSTALVHACDSNDAVIQCRAPLDRGSQSHFITRDFVQSPQLESRPCNFANHGFGNNTTAGTRRVQITSNSRPNAFTASSNRLVVDKIAYNLPATTVKRSATIIPRNIKLSFFHSITSVDLLIGAGLFWELNFDCDASVPCDVHTQCKAFKSQLARLNEVRVPRCVKFNTDPRNLQLPGFCDASKMAYGACIYVRSRSTDDEYRAELLCAKSRVAPFRAVSLPHLELCANLLLAEQHDKVRSAIGSDELGEYFCSDSTIALNSITSSSKQRSTFVANRAGERQQLTRVSSWKHAKTEFSPADIVSRGATPNTLLNSSLWWRGPEWLRANVNSRPEIAIPLAEDGLPGENSRAIEALCRYVQAKEFPKEMRALLQSRAIKKSSNLLPPPPFLHSEGTIRVGGRLKISNEGYEVRHPILLTKGPRSTHQTIDHEHTRNMHAGTQATMASIRRRFLTLSLCSKARKRLRQCAICFKARPRVSETIMGQLPIARVTLSRPFSHTGLDYVGPFMIRDGKRRDSRSIKAYIAILTCFPVKAIHIELVGDHTTESFLGALKQFISRGDKVRTIYSDNGINFMGAARELKELYDLFIQEHVRAFISEFGTLFPQAASCEIESILNSRSITPFSNNPRDFALFNSGSPFGRQALNSFPQANPRNIAENWLSRWQRVAQLYQHSWQQWRREYPSQLPERRKWERDKGEQLEPGRSVMIHRQGLPPTPVVAGTQSKDSRWDRRRSASSYWQDIEGNHRMALI